MNALTDTYYLKALDEYDYDLPAFLEAVNYALAYDENNADAHCLKGRFYMEQMLSYEEARQHFELALANDINHIQTHYDFLRWAVETNHFKLGLKLLKKAETITGICHAKLMYCRGNLFEKQTRLKKAKNCYQKAQKMTVDASDYAFFSDELARVKSKLKSSKLSRK